MKRRSTGVVTAAAMMLWLAAPLTMHAQAGRGGAPSAKASDPIDLTGYWAAVVTEDWRLRMLGAPKGDFGVGPPGAIVRPGANPYGTGANPAEAGSIPYKVIGAKAALQWDPAKDEAEGNVCKAFGAAGIMRQPTNLHITWQDDNTLKLETDFGMQTRVFHFITAPRGGQMSYQSGIYSPADPPKFDAPAGTGPSLQGYSAALWYAAGGDREGYERSGSLKVVTSRLTPGYYWRNGMPYTANAVVTEHYRILDLPDQSRWIVLVLIVEDPEYLTQPFIVNYHFKKLPDGSAWHPTPCSVR
jgi:hypothetical protein